MADVDTEIHIQQILLAAAHHDLESLRTLLRTGSANVQDTDTGYTPLHSAIAACTPEEDPTPQVNGDVDEGASEDKVDLERAEKTLKLLFQNGAIWNDLDANNETPGCLAWRLGLKSLYEIVVDAGVRAELLLNRLDEYEPLGDTGDESESEEDDPETDAASRGDILTTDETTLAEPAMQVTHETDRKEQDTEDAVSNARYLNSELSFQNGRILDGNANGVMMAWEMDIMQRTADLILPQQGLSVLNVGHGMGIIDVIIEAKNPSSHHIIEAHPAVLEKMRETGWTQKPNVHVHEGRWQDILPSLLEQNVTFDAIFFDTFAEDYKAFRLFFNEYVIALLKPQGVWSFFHGLGADRQVCYDVYTKLVEMDLFEADFDTVWTTIDTPNVPQSQEWEGVRRRYWALEKYKLPTCTFIT